MKWHTADSGAISAAIYQGPVIGDFPSATLTPPCPTSPGTNNFGWAIYKLAVLSPVYEHNVTEYYHDCAACETCDEECVLGKKSVGLGSLEVTIGLGNDAHRSVGSLSLREPYTSPNLAHPAALRWNLDAGAKVLRATDPETTLRQIKTPQGLVDIVVTNPFRAYEMRFYDVNAMGAPSPTTGLHQPTGAPYKTVAVENPDPALWTLTGVVNNTPLPNSFLNAPAHGLPAGGLFNARITSSTGILPVSNFLGQLKATQIYVVYSHPSFPNALILAYEPVPGSGNYSLDYFVSADLTATLTVSSPFPYDRVKITESGGAHLKASTYQFGFTPATQTLSWSLAQSVNGALLKTDRRTLVEDFNVSTGVYLVNTTDWVEDAQQQILTKKAEVRRVYPWNDYASNWTALRSEPISEILDPDGAALTTTYAYYDNFATDGPNYGRLKERVNPDGGWERYQYDAAGRVTRLYRSYQGSAPASAHAGNEVVAYTYDQPVTLSGTSAGLMTTTITSLDNQEVSRTYRIAAQDTASTLRRDITIETRNTGAAWDATGNLWTQRWTLAGGDFDGRTARELRPDGTATIYEYARDPGTGHETTTVSSGVPDSGLATITRGTRIVTITNDKGGQVSRDTYDIAAVTTLVDSELTLGTDPFGRPRDIAYLDGTLLSRNYDCCGLASQTDREGILTAFTRDHAGRVVTATRAGVTNENGYDPLGRVRLLKRYPAGQPSAAIVLSQSDYDVAGRLISTRDRGRETAYVETPQPAQRRSTRLTRLPFDAAWPAADRGEVTEITWADGRAASRIGNATAPAAYSYSTATLGEAAALGYAAGTRFRVITETKLDGAGSATLETMTSFLDPLGRTVKTAYADGAASFQVYNDLGQLVRQTDPDGVQTLFVYDQPGELRVTALDLNRNGQIDYAGADRITRTTREVGVRSEGAASIPVQRVTTEAWDVSGADTPRILSVAESSVDGLRRWQTSTGQTTATLTAYNPSAAARSETVTFPDGTSLVRTFSNGRLATEARLDAAQQQVTGVTHGYDAHGRTSTATDSLGRTTTYAYHGDDQLQTVTTPDPDPGRTGSGYDPQTTTYRYDAAGRADLVTQHDGAETHTSHWPTGQVKRTWSGRAYPQAFTYDTQGRLKTLTTWQAFAGASGAAVTTWNYDPQRGWLGNKRYSDGKGPDYTYSPSGRLKTRAWQRGVLTTYGYTNAGEVNSIAYSDATPAVSQTYDRLGRLATTTDAAGLLTRGYDPASLLPASETYSGTGLLSGRSLTRAYDSLNRPQGLTTDAGYTVAYGYDPAGRLFTVAQGIHLAQYGYKAGVGTVETISMKRSGVETLLHERTTDALGRISRVRSSAGANVVAQRDYTHNHANQRTRATREDNAYWQYEYDALGQVTAGRKRLSTDALINGFDFGWSFDDIGNRKTATVNAQISNYSANLLNQYSSRTVPGMVDVMGAAQADATVTVMSPATNGTVFPTTRQGELYFKQLTVDNSTAAQYASLKVTGVKNLAGPSGEDAVAEEVRSAFVPQAPEVYVHDDDGNLTQDARWTYIWNGENRLVGMEARAPAVAAGAPNRKLEFAYDASGRRIAKNVYDWNGTAWLLVSSTRFVYDGWNLIAEFDALSTPTLTRSHVWGLDLSESMQGAGGVGGLLAVSLSNGSTHSACFDGNGNVIAYVDMATGAKSATYDYSAFGETLTAAGPAAALFPFRFSTKYTDSETSHLYYGFRYYHPSTGRWPNRDPMGELGHETLYNVGSFEAAPSWQDSLELDLPQPDIPSVDELLLPDGSPYLGMRNNHLSYIDPDGRAAQPIIVGAKILVKEALKLELKRRAKRAAECVAIHAAYDRAEKNCRACRRGTPLAEANKNFACWSAVAAGRSLYLSKKCDYYLAGSIDAGSKRKEANHKLELAKVLKVAADCLSCVRTGENKLPTP